jgi:glycosyltransferase involved in cell wall biosynthesis
LGQIPENVTGWTGQQYQAFIRRGYSAGKNFISVSKHTREDLHEFLGHVPPISEVVYNGLNKKYNAAGIKESQTALESALSISVKQSFILHVGGNQWYKNRVGVVRIYNAWRKSSRTTLPLLLIGESPDAQLTTARNESPYKEDVHFVTNVDDNIVRYAYSAATLLLFPSLAEGFGWPIAEAMACGCVVVTTNKAPMTEVGENAALYIPSMPHDSTAMVNWSEECAEVVESVVRFSPQERAQIVNEGYQTIKRFDLSETLPHIENIYERCISSMIQ